MESVRQMRPGEVKRFEGLTPTFHRGYDPVLIVSDQALYVPRQLYTGRTKRGTWVRLPIECVREMEIRDASNRFYATVGGLMSAGGVVGLITTVLGGLRGSRWGSLALCALALWIGLEVIRGGAGRSTLIIHHAGGILEWSTPLDSYKSVKRADRRILLDFLEAARLAGVADVHAARL